MSSRAERNGKALSFLIVLTLALGGVFATVVALTPVARAGTCDQVGGVITQTWTITTTQVCTGILYTVDATININSGGSLTLVNGGLSFAKDQAHQGYALNVNAGGELVLNNSIVTTQPNAISPYVKLALTVSGAGSHFAMTNGAMLKFPGWFNATGATVDVTRSTITGFTAADLAGVGLYQDDNDDSPVIAWSSTTASLYGSRIEKIYENASASTGSGVTGIVEGNVTLTGGSNLYAYDTYIGADYSNIVGLHNELQVDATSNAYLYNVTTDPSQNPTLKTNWMSAFRPLAATGSVYLFRWLHATAVDSTAFPVTGATIWSQMSPGATTAQYPDNAASTTPSARTLAYLAKTSSGATAWNLTDARGQALIPLWTDQITQATLPNAQSFGNYQLTFAYSTTTAPGGVDFNPYPATNWDDNNKGATVPLNVQVRTLPDLMLKQSDYVGTMNVVQNQPFLVYAIIYNQGQTNATLVDIAAFVNNRATQVARVNGLSILAGGSVNQTLNVVGVSTVGVQPLELIVDPDSTINEGGVAQESNNFANITVNVQPPPQGFTAISTPSSGDSVQPGTQLSVTGYIRSTSGLNPIPGVQVTIELRNSAGTAIASNTTMSGSPDGLFIGTINVPSNAPDGSYTVVVTPTSSQIQPDSRAVTVSKTISFIYTPVPFLGIPWWLFLIVLAAAVAAGIGITLYWKVFGLGKMVECGECGAFIPEDATTCPKCGVEFEKDMAKCSNCQAWIPVDVKQCPECGVEFATGEVEMADYEEKMRLQYDEVVRKFQDDAEQQLGRSLAETEFQDWWRKQPTFLTFEDWLREEEEMRKMGSKPCPVCGTLNSVTATVCHKCGSLMRDERPPSGGGSAPAVPATQRTAGPSAAPSGGPSATQSSTLAALSGQSPAPGADAVPRRVIRKPLATQPVIQKKVVKKTLEAKDDQESEDKSESGADPESEDNS